MAAAGAVIAGGHSVRDGEVKYGLSVTGIIHPGRILTNGRARVGDMLVLTKPLGSGTLTTAAKQEKITESELVEAIDVMTDLNAGACDAAIEVGIRDAVHAGTDITGFGLIGHAHEMAEASGVTIEIDARAVPLMKKTLELAAAGVVTRAAKSNLEHLGSRFQNHGVDDTLVKVLADAQTSGGLLMAVAANRVDALLAALSMRKTRSACIVGRVANRGESDVVLH